MSLIKAVWSAAASRFPAFYWLRRGLSYYSGRQESECEKLMHEEVAGTVARLDPARVLEYGVGNAAFLKKLSQRLPSAEFFGVDISRTQLQVARKIFPTARLSTSDLSRLDFPSDHFDVVVGLGVLIYLPSSARDRAFRELFRVTRGHLVAAEYVTKYFDGALMGRYKAADDFRYDYDIEESLRRAGFSIARAEKIAPCWDPRMNTRGELPHAIIVARKAA